MNRFDDQDFFTPEREQKLDLLLHLLRNGRKPILLRAPAGAGKTYFLKKLSDRLGQLGDVIQLDQLSLVDGIDDLLDSLEAKLHTENTSAASYLSGKSANEETVYLIAEDIHAMSSDGVNALMGLFKQYGCVQLVLSASENVGQAEQWCQVINLESFSQKQTVEYAKCLVSEIGEPVSRLNGLDELVLFIETGGLPGRIHDAVSKYLLSVPTVSVSQPQNLQRANLFYIVPFLVVILALAITAWLYLDDDSSRVSSEPAVVTPKMVQKDQVVAMPVELEAKQSVGPEEQKGEQVAADTKPVEDGGDSSTSTETEVISIDKTIESGVEKTTQIVESKHQAEPEIEAAKSLERKPDRQPDVTVSQPIAAKSKVVIAETKPKSSPLEVDRAWIRSMPPEQYTFQIMGLGKLSSALGYVQKLPKRENVYIYQSRRNNGAWYGILYGVYADKTAATQSIPEVKRLFPGIEPWARSFDSIQKDLY